MNYWFVRCGKSGNLLTGAERLKEIGSPLPHIIYKRIINHGGYSVFADLNSV
jgi:hypothetical protein